MPARTENSSPWKAADLSPVAQEAELAARLGGGGGGDAALGLSMPPPPEEKEVLGGPSCCRGGPRALFGAISVPFPLNHIQTQI